MGDGRIIGLISGKGGVGKTSTCVNLGVAMSNFGERVTLVDADFSASNLDVYLGRYEHPLKIQDALRGEGSIENLIFRHPTGVDVIASSNEIDKVEPDTTDLRPILERAAENSDYVLVDCPPGLDSTVESIIEACDTLIIMTMPTQTAGVNAAQIIEKAKEQQKSVLGTVINKVQGNPDKELVSREVEMMTESHILGEIPYDPKMKEALFNHQPLINYDPLAEASIEINKLAADLSGNQYEKPKFAKLKRKLNNLRENISN